MFNLYRKTTTRAGLAALLLSSLSAIAELRDPTLPANQPASQPASSLPSGETALKLTAIRISDKSRRAIINGDTVAVGQVLNDGSKVVKIHARSVVVFRNGETKKLVLVPFVKKPVK